MEELDQARDGHKGLLAEYQEQLQSGAGQSAYRQLKRPCLDLMDESKNKRAWINSEAIQKNHSNFYAGVKSVLQEAERLEASVGCYENLSFSKDYQTALEIAWG